MALRDIIPVRSAVESPPPPNTREQLATEQERAEVGPLVVAMADWQDAKLDAARADELARMSHKALAAAERMAVVAQAAADAAREALTAAQAAAEAASRAAEVSRSALAAAGGETTALDDRAATTHLVEDAAGRAFLEQMRGRGQRDTELQA